MRINGKYCVVYGTILPDTIKHQDSDGNYVEGEVLTIKQAPFFDNSLQSARDTVQMVMHTDNCGRLVWANIVETETGNIVESTTVYGILEDALTVGK